MNSKSSICARLNIYFVNEIKKRINIDVSVGRYNCEYVLIAYWLFTNTTFSFPGKFNDTITVGINPLLSTYHAKSSWVINIGGYLTHDVYLHILITSQYDAFLKICNYMYNSIMS